MKIYKLPLEMEDFDDIMDNGLIVNPKSELPFSTQLIYLANIAIPCDMDLSELTDEELKEICLEYLKCKRFVYIKSIADIILASLLKLRGVDSSIKTIDLSDIDLSKEMVFLDSILMYLTLRFAKKNIRITNDITLEKCDDIINTNVVSLIYNDLILEYMSTSKEFKEYTTMWDDDYILEDKNLICHIMDSKLSALLGYLYLNYGDKDEQL